MQELLTAAQMRAIEQAAIDSGDVTGLELMERAGQGVVDAILARWPDLAKPKHRAAVLCGPGNNGGDGFVIARLLAKAGWLVNLYLYGTPDKLPKDAATNHRLWSAIGATLSLGRGQDASDIAKADVVVDALFGTGLTRPILGLAEMSWLSAPREDRANDHSAQSSRPRVVAVDFPSGVCSDSGKCLVPDIQGETSLCVQADMTVTFHCAKLGHYLSDAPLNCGDLRLVDIGLGGPQAALRTAPKTVLSSPALFLLDKGLSSHKFSHGHALILSGGPGKGGAARLAARGALRIGAGVVTLGCPAAALPENAAQLNAIMLRSIKTPGDIANWLGSDPRINAVCVGPGLGCDAKQADLLAAILTETHPNAAARGPGSSPGPRGVVLDADALTLLSRDAALMGLVHDNCVLTPHAGEFARLFPDISERLRQERTSGPAYSKVNATRAAAARAGCVVLFKGPDTVIAAPDGTASINSAQYQRAAPWLATAGSGDVLAGFITGLLARGFAPMQAVQTAAWLHVRCALTFGPGLIAEDLPEILPHVLRDILPPSLESQPQVV